MRFAKKDFNNYVKAVKELVKAFGLTGWELTYSFLPLEQGEFANVTFQSDQHKACFSMTTAEFNDYEYAKPDEVALHEVLHLLLANLYAMAKSREYNEDSYIAEEHAVLNSIMRVYRNLAVKINQSKKVT
jgi:hypothetical protein